MQDVSSITNHSTPCAVVTVTRRVWKYLLEHLVKSSCGFLDCMSIDPPVCSVVLPERHFAAGVDSDCARREVEREFTE